MTIRIGETAPDFLAESTDGPISLYNWAQGSWVLFFSHPADFTPVCTSEMGRTAELAENFTKRGVKLLGLSTDSVEQHAAWKNDIKRITNHVPKFPIISDPELHVSRLYEMIHPKENTTSAIRAIFLLDQDLCVRLTMSYPINVGRNFDEILRAIDAVQLTDTHNVATPADWVRGDPVLISHTISDEEAEIQFPQGWQQLRHYYRVTVVKSTKLENNNSKTIGSKKAA